MLYVVNSLHACAFTTYRKFGLTAALLLPFAVRINFLVNKIDVMVLYSNDSLTGDGVHWLESNIWVALEKTNEAFKNSGVSDVELNVVHMDTVSGILE